MSKVFCHILSPVSYAVRLPNDSGILKKYDAPVVNTEKSPAIANVSVPDRSVMCSRVLAVNTACPAPTASVSKPLILDSDLRDADRVSFHPCDNSASVVLSHDMFMRFLELWGGEYEWLEI